MRYSHWERCGRCHAIRGGCVCDIQPDPIATDERPTWELVIDDMHARDHLGRAKYGTPHQAGNGRSHLRDLYDELLDAACYVRAQIALEEGG